MSPYFFFAFVLSLFVICESSFVDMLHTCPKDNGECQGKQLQNMIQTLAKSGAPEFNLPPFDPHEVKNLKVPILEAVDLVFDGLAKGIKNCIVKKFTPNIDKRFCILDIICDIVVKGTYKLLSTSPTGESSTGERSTGESMFKGQPVSGNGNGKVSLEQFNLILKTPYDVVKRGNDIFFVGKTDKVTYTFDFGKMTLAANKIYLGNVEASAAIVKFINDNPKEVLKTLGKPIFDVAVQLVSEFSNSIISNLPTKYYITEDLSPYVNKEL